MSRLVDLAAIPPLEMRPGSVIARRIEGERITMAVFELQPGAVVPEHEHPAEQMGLCIRGQHHVHGRRRDAHDRTRRHVERPVWRPASRGGRHRRAPSPSRSSRPSVTTGTAPLLPVQPPLWPSDG